MRHGFATTGDLDGLAAFHAREDPFQVLLELAHRYGCPSHARYYVLQIVLHQIRRVESAGDAYRSHRNRVGKLHEELPAAIGGVDRMLVLVPAESHKERATGCDQIGDQKIARQQSAGSERRHRRVGR